MYLRFGEGRLNYGKQCFSTGRRSGDVQKGWSENEAGKMKRCRGQLQAAWRALDLVTDVIQAKSLATSNMGGQTH